METPTLPNDIIMRIIREATATANMDYWIEQSQRHYNQHRQRPAPPHPALSDVVLTELAVEEFREETDDELSDYFACDEDTDPLFSLTLLVATIAADRAYG